MIADSLKIEVDGKFIRINGSDVEIMDADGRVAASAKVQVAAGSAQGEFSEIFED